MEAPGSAIRRFSMMVAARGLIFFFAGGDGDDASDDDGLGLPCRMRATSEPDDDDECDGEEISLSSL